jgi:hypothetical protein
VTNALFTAGWLAWIVGFAVLEGAALRRRRTGDTLSEHVWRWFAVLGPRSSVRTWAGRLALLAGGVWLTGHLAFGIWSF